MNGMTGMGISSSVYRDLLFAEWVRQSYGLVRVPMSYKLWSAKDIATQVEELGGEIRSYERGKGLLYFAKPDDIKAALAMLRIRLDDFDPMRTVQEMLDE